jgi:hypothetical protein
MPRARDNQILVEILEECAKTLAWLEALEAKAQRHGFKRDSLKLAKQNVRVLKAQCLEAISENK